MFKSKFFLILYAITVRVFIDFIGRLMLAEIIALVSFPFLNIAALLKKFEGLKVVFKGLLLYLFIQIVSDYFNNSLAIDYLRGWSVIVFSIVSVAFLVKHLSINLKAIIPFLFTLLVVRLFFGEGDLDLNMLTENSNFFKVRFVGFLNIGIMLIGFYLFKFKKRGLVPIIFFIYAILCFVLDARSNGLIFAVSATLLFIKGSHISFSKGKVFVLAVFVSGIFYLGYLYYINQVLYNDLGGANAKNQISKMANPNNPFELIYYGRTEAVIAIYAISEKPILGHGSWAKDKEGKYLKLQAELAESDIITDRGFIPNHSLLLGAWLFSGIFGFLAISIILIYLLKEYFKIFKNKSISPMLPILTVLAIDMCWAMFFSPFGLLRTSFPIFAALIIIYKKEYEQIQIKNIKKWNNNTIKN